MRDTLTNQPGSLQSSAGVADKGENQTNWENQPPLTFGKLAAARPAGK